MSDKIETLDDWNARLAMCGCCTMPTCPVPTMECESITGSAVSVGFHNPEETEWQIYPQHKVGATYSVSDSVTGSYLHYDEDVPYISQTTEASGTSWEMETYDYTYSATVGPGGEDCFSRTAAITETCGASGSSTQEGFSPYGWGGTEEPPLEPTYTVVLYQDWSLTMALADVSGTETPEHAEWVISSGEWDTEHPDFESEMEAYTTAHAAWETAMEAWDTAYAAWADAWNAWSAEGRIGDEPVEPDAAPEEPVAPTERPSEPDENYPPCTYESTETYTVFNPCATASEEDNSCIAGPPNEPIVTKTIVGPTGVGDLFSGGTTTPSDEYLGEALTQSAWFGTVAGVLAGHMTFPKPDCTGGACEASRASEAPETNGASASLSLVAVRYRWRVPSSHGGSYFKITWDIVTEPVGFDEMIDDPEYTPPEEEPEGGFPPVPQIPKPGRPAATLEADVGTWEWSGPGDTEDATDASWFSGWYDLDPPAEPGTKRVVNVRFECYRSPYGNKPQLTGEGYELPA